MDRKQSILALFKGALLLCASTKSDAMVFDLQKGDGNAFFIEGNGPIVAGDRVKLISAIDEIPPSGTLSGLAISSPGGSLLEAERLASTVRSFSITVGVGPHKVCASACFLLLAAAPRKFVTTSSHVGVHSASDAGSENLGSMGFTVAMARDAAAYGVPDSILGHMVATEPEKMFWLDQADLTSMGVKVFPDETQNQSAKVDEKPEVPSILAPERTASDTDPSQSSPSLVFQQGLADRQKIETWIKGLDPDGRAGAEYWASQRSLKHPGSCTPPPDADLSDSTKWSTGCANAQQLFAIADRRRKSELAYKAGWNSLRTN